jgi:hypothetical protein
MSQYKQFPLSAPPLAIKADFSVCTYDGCDANPSAHFGAPLCLLHGKMIAVQAMTLALPAEEPRSPQPRRKPDETPGSVYVIQHGNRVKIGFSKNVKVRLTNLPYERIIAIIPGDRRLEHAMLTKFKSIRTSGEWFEAHPDLIAFAESLARKAAA